MKTRQEYAEAIEHHEISISCIQEEINEMISRLTELEPNEKSSVDYSDLGTVEFAWAFIHKKMDEISDYFMNENRRKKINRITKYDD